jgi:prepilin-type N-terminal cleavage/methylation domain-containing protein
MRRICRQRGFTLAEIIVVVALLAILGTGALVGLKRSRDNTALRKTVQNLSAIDLAKQTWQRFHPNGTWPTNELDRWSAGFFRNDRSADTHELLVGMTQTIRRTFKHGSRHQKGVHDPLRTLALGSGSCRDLAVLMIAAQAAWAQDKSGDVTDMQALRAAVRADKKAFVAARSRKLPLHDEQRLRATPSLSISCSVRRHCGQVTAPMIA